MGTRLLILILAVIAGFLFAFLLKIGRHGWAFLAAVGLGLLSIAEFVVADLIIDSRFPRETRDWLELLRDRLVDTGTHDEIVRELTACVGRFRGCDHSQVSSTVHLRVSLSATGSEEAPTGLIQLSHYTRPGLGGRRWRVVESTKGIVGRCLRVEEMVWVNFRSAQEYRTRMVKEFGFSQTETEQHTIDARSYLAFPLQQEGATIGILYFFSTEPQVFPHAAEPVELAQTAAAVVGLLRTAGIL